MWKKSISGESEIQRAGWIANHVYYDNVIRIDKHENYNGSGHTAFGGDKKWPVLDVHISFETGQEKLRDNIADKIKKLIDDMLPE